MYLRHEGADGPRTLATDVEYAEGPLQQAVGLMFRSEVPPEYALAFPFDGVRRRGIHTVFVRVPIDVVWVADGAVMRVKTMRPWADVGLARADLVVELAAGGADGVESGDRLWVAGEENNRHS